MQRRANTQTVQWFLEILASNQLDLDPAYQRRSVWNTTYRQFYVDTVLRNFPSPPIYLQVETRPGAPTIYHVIDGKQRLEALKAFTRDEFHLGERLADEGLSNPYYSDLPESIRDSFVDYALIVENITRASAGELREAFDRLNRNVAKLNAQELRKARFEGAFISLSTTLADDPFFATLGFSTLARVRRMIDVEFASELLLVILKGPQDGKSTVLDKAYIEYDDEVPEEEQVVKSYRSTIDYLKTLPLDWKRARWRNTADFYGLWLAVLNLEKSNDLPQPEKAATRLSDFEKRVRVALDDPESTDRAARAYLNAVRQGSNKLNNRSTRWLILSSIMQGLEVPADLPTPEDEADGEDPTEL